MNGEFALLFLSYVGFIAYTVIAAYLGFLIYIGRKQIKEEKEFEIKGYGDNGE